MLTITCFLVIAFAYPVPTIFLNPTILRALVQSASTAFPNGASFVLTAPSSGASSETRKDDVGVDTGSASHLVFRRRMFVLES
uniref:Putative secreted protein n=1 Tax=Ixodes ricinus TaxID=34613 RepID=A0A6B0U851_IXORI